MKSSIDLISENTVIASLVSVRLQRGLSLIELMISITLGLIILTALSSLFFNQSRARVELDKSNRMIENGRYALDLLTRDLQLAGYLGEYVPPVSSCSYSPVAIGGHDADLVSKPASLPAGITAADVRTGSDVLVIRRASTETPVVADAAVAGVEYIQVSLCQHDALDYVISKTPADFKLRQKSCTPTSTAPYANVRPVLTHVYFISPDNTPGDGIPTLKRLEAGNPTPVPLVEGIEYMQIEYGIDSNNTMQITADTHGGSLLLDNLSSDPVRERIKPGMGVYHEAVPAIQKIPEGYTVGDMTQPVGATKGTITLLKDAGSAPIQNGLNIPLTIPYLTATVTPGSTVLTNVSAEPSYALVRVGHEICGGTIAVGSNIVSVSQPPAPRTITLSKPPLPCDPANPAAVCPLVKLIIPSIEISPRAVAGDGFADFFTATPTTVQWANVVSVKLTLLARNTERTRTHTDTKQYVLGRNAAGVNQTFGPANDDYKRHVYTQLIRMTVVAGRRETPTW